MSAPRVDKVQRLSQAALVGMEKESQDATSGEVVSACAHIMMISMLAVQELDGNLESFRSVIEKMYALLPPLPKKGVN